MNRLQEIEKTVRYHEAVYKNTRERLKEIKKEKILAQVEIESLEEVKGIVFEIGGELHRIILGVFSEIGTTCLQSIFGEVYEYQMRGKISRGLLAIEHVVIDSEGNELNPLLAMGGGLVDVLAFALRLGALILSDAGRLLVLDEPFRFLSRDKLPVMREVQALLADEYSIQTLMVTHLAELVPE